MPNRAYAVSHTECIYAVPSSFLPQDKVSEFAQMSPQQLLRETQRAAGDAHLTKWHDVLIDSGKELKAMHEVMYTHHTKDASNTLTVTTANERGTRIAQSVRGAKCST